MKILDDDDMSAGTSVGRDRSERLAAVEGAVGHVHSVSGSAKCFAEVRLWDCRI